MVRDITLGQYYPGNSVFHRLDARTKIIWTLVYIIALFVVNSFTGFAVAGGVLLGIILISKVPIKFIFRGLKVIFLILIFTFVLNM